jgi:hypothetical protein
MLYKDGVRVYLDTDEGISQKCQRVLKELKGLANTKGIVRFKTLPGMKNPGLFIPLQANVKTPDGAFTMVYAENVQRKGDQLVFSPTTLRWPASGSVDLNRDPELAIFLYGFSTLCYNGKSPNKSNVCWFMIEDTVREAESKVSISKTISKVTSMVLETTDAGGAPLQIVTNYARSRGMRFHDEENETVVRSKILDVIERGNLYDDFMDALNNRKYFEHTDLVTNMVEYGLLKVFALTKGGQDKAWRYVNEDGSPGDIICRIPMKSNAKAHILDKLDQEPWTVEAMQEMVRVYLESLEEPPDPTPIKRGRKPHDFKVEVYEKPLDDDPVDEDAPQDGDGDDDGDDDELLDALSSEFEPDNDDGDDDNEGVTGHVNQPMVGVTGPTGNPGLTENPKPPVTRKPRGPNKPKTKPGTRGKKTTPKRK